MTLLEGYNYSVYFLSANGIDEAEFKSLCLVCSLAGIKNSEFELHRNDEIIMKRLADSLWKLKSGEPLQYVLGKWDFYESEFFVGKGVLIPRPETEELAELVIRAAEKLEAPVIYDLCSGSGCIGISIARAVKSSKVYAVEKSAEAFEYLLKNSLNDKNVNPVMADIYDELDLESADIIVSNPPYIKTSDLPLLQQEVLCEPEIALDGGADGLDFYRHIASEWRGGLKEKGILFFEIGDDQGSRVRSILESNGYSEIEVIKDIYGNDRIVKALKE